MNGTGTGTRHGHVPAYGEVVPGWSRGAGPIPSSSYRRQLAAMLQTSIDILRWEDVTNYVGLAGARVSDNMIRAVVTLTASLIGIALRQLVLGSSSSSSASI